MKIIELNFATRTDREVRGDALLARPPGGIYYWLLLDPDDNAEADSGLEKLGIPADLRAAFLSPAPERPVQPGDEALYFSLTEAGLDQSGLTTGELRFLVGRHYLVIKRSQPSPVVERMLLHYREDFVKFARSPGFLIFEAATEIGASYRRVFHHYAAEVARVQVELFGEVTDAIFKVVARLTADILAFRRMVLWAGDQFKELSERKSDFVSETAQPALSTMADRLQRLGDELEGERVVLTEALNLYMGMVSYQTNRVLNRLTVLSLIFLPLSFLTGVYGMNFEHLPEVRWTYAYPVFWGVVVLFLLISVIILKRKRWI